MQFHGFKARISGVETLSTNPLIKAVLEGFQRKLAKPKKKKVAAMAEMLKEIVELAGSRHC